jgi:alpha 1,3-glucosidase
MQGGNIMPLRTRARRASTLMWRDPFTLVVALGREGDARGEVYLDDGESFGYEKGDFVWRGFQALSTKGETVVSSFDKVEGDGSALTRRDGWASEIADVRVEKIVVLGLDKQPSKVTVDGETKALEWEWESGMAASGKKEGRASRLTIKAPGVRIVREWSIRIA